MCLKCPQGVCPRLEEVVCNEEQLGQSLQAVNHKLTSLQENMSACQAQKESSAALITDAPALEVRSIKSSDFVNHGQALLHFVFHILECWEESFSTLSHLYCISIYLCLSVIF